MRDLRTMIREHLQWGPIEHGDRLRFMALALCGEAGELSEFVVLTLALCGKSGSIANLFKKDWRGDAGGEDRLAKIKSEIADVGNYVFMMAEALDMDLQAAMLAKLKAVEQRPEWKSRLDGR